jgi:hypothetical protein
LSLYNSDFKKNNALIGTSQDKTIFKIDYLQLLANMLIFEKMFF